MKTTLIKLVATLTLAGAAYADPGPGHQVLVLKNRNGAALLGYDAVAYFTGGKPAKGSPKFQSEYEGAKYYFASAEHQALFEAAPAKYAPAYGGYCGYAASLGRLSPISPKWFQIVEGRLVLQHNRKAYELFNADLKGNLAKADRNWPGLVDREVARQAVVSKYPLTWPGFYDYGNRNRPTAPVGGGSTAAHRPGADRVPMPGDLAWPGY